MWDGVFNLPSLSLLTQRAHSRRGPSRGEKRGATKHKGHQAPIQGESWSEAVCPGPGVAPAWKLLVPPCQVGAGNLHADLSASGSRYGLGTGGGGAVLGGSWNLKRAPRAAWPGLRPPPRPGIGHWWARLAAHDERGWGLERAWGWESGGSPHVLMLPPFAMGLWGGVPCLFPPCSSRRNDA